MPSASQSTKVSEPRSNPTALILAACASRSPLFNRAADAFELFEIPPDQKSFADDVRFRYEAPIATVIAAVAVVTHHEVMTAWNLAREAFFIVGAIFAE